MKPNSSPKRSMNLVDIFELVLLSWPWLIAFAAAGVGGGYAWTVLKPPIYEAAAVVQVDHNPEDALDDNIWRLNVRQEYFLEDQTRLLEGTAFSDSVAFSAITALQADGIDLADDASLFFTNATMPHPAQGTWRLVIREADGALAADKANAWAEAFVSTAQQSVDSARQLHARKVQSTYLAAQLAAAELRCNRFPSALERVEQQQSTITPEDPDAPLSTLTRWALGELSAEAGFYHFAESHELVSNSDALLYLQDLHLLMEDELSYCPELLESMQIPLDESLGAETELEEYSAGFSPYLEISLKKAAFVPSKPIVQPSRAVSIGALLGLAAGLIWLLLQFSLKVEDEGQP